ncbi:MAG TPA: hypothetical protein PLX20_12365 [Rhodocyclaceae bacterium]|nr:hypothetical protein [Rhodocyclaceae bacterium]HMV54896.1 hypothetical protein [Rhodocyclaceae bacterium]HMZ83626.1 hypothetical protein [Rhodocyclaceae bacterium]HNA04798.1 hypothetical protein [Rhodocyclaceae bacterium]HNB77292.1 hypothetical protein [Rhodocyclaceae bacterium]
MSVHIRKITLVAAFAAVLLCAACSREAPPPPPATRPGVFDPQIKAMEAARNIEGALKEGEEARRRQLDAAEK